MPNVELGSIYLTDVQKQVLDFLTEVGANDLKISERETIHRIFKYGLNSMSQEIVELSNLLKNNDSEK